MPSGFSIPEHRPTRVVDAFYLAFASTTLPGGRLEQDTITAIQGDNKVNTMVGTTNTVPSTTPPGRHTEEGTILLEDGKSTGSSVIEPNSVEWKGRTYHGFDEGAYLLPNDGPEQDRLDLQHAMCTLMLDKNFGLAPFEVAPRSVLDIATGTGIWPLEFARQHPESHVVGTDLSLIQPDPDVSNCEFFRENSETSEWIFPYFFDYIYCRYCAFCFSDITTVIRKAFDYLQPGGYIELFDIDPQVQFEGDMGNSSAWNSYSQALCTSLTNQGRDPYKARQYKTYLEAAGLRDVVETIIPGPFSPWMEDPKFKQIGIFGREDTKNIFRSGGINKLLMGAGLSYDEATQITEQCVRECDECKVHFWFNNYVVYGRKPYETEMTDIQKTEWKAMQQKVAQLPGKSA